MKNKYLSIINHKYFDNISSIEDIELYDLFETDNFILYVIVDINKEKNLIRAKKFPLKSEVEEKDFILNLSKEEDLKQLYFLFKSKEKNKKENRFYFKLEKYTKQNFDKSEAKNYKLHDIIIDSSNKSWFINSIDIEENKIEVVKLPVVLDQLAHTFLSVEKEIIQDSIKEIWR